MSNLNTASRTIHVYSFLQLSIMEKFELHVGYLNLKSFSVFKII